MRTAGGADSRQTVLVQKLHVRALTDLDAHYLTATELSQVIFRRHRRRDPALAAECPAAEDRIALRGSAIRKTAVKVLIDDPRRPQTLHYRDWFALLEHARYAVAGTDPLPCSSPSSAAPRLSCPGHKRYLPTQCKGRRTGTPRTQRPPTTAADTDIDDKQRDRPEHDP